VRRAIVSAAALSAITLVVACGGSGNTVEQWTVSGQLSGTSEITGVECVPGVDNYADIELSGMLNGQFFHVRLEFDENARGELTYGDPSSYLFVVAEYGTGQIAPYRWSEEGGAIGSGTATIDGARSGSLQLTVPPSGDVPGQAAQPITIAGKWSCPSPVAAASGV
jgi:hypothetical protein